VALDPTNPQNTQAGDPTGTAEIGSPITAVMAARLTAAAVERDGPAALVCAERSTALLVEAGHCVVSACEGTIATRATIWPTKWSSEQT
jgi:hypothetical protein